MEYYEQPNYVLYQTASFPILRHTPPNIGNSSMEASEQG